MVVASTTDTQAASKVFTGGVVYPPLLSSDGKMSLEEPRTV